MKIFRHKSTVFTTKQGLTVLNVAIPNYPISTSSLWVNAGSKYDPLGKEGLSHLTEHILFARTKSHPDRNDRLNLVESNGFYYNAFTSLQNQHYFYVHSKEKSQLALRLLIDGYTSSIFDEKQLEAEKQVILAEEEQNRSDASNYIWRLANKGLWGKEQLGKDFYGNKQTLSSISLKDIQTFQKMKLISENTVYCFINSSLSPSEQNKILDNLGSSDLHRSTNNFFMKMKTQEKITFEKRGDKTLTVALSFLTGGFANNRTRVLQEFIGSYFAGGWISRFIQILRIRNNLIYWIYPEVVSLEKTGYIRFYFSVNPENLNIVLSLIHNELLEAQQGIIHNLQSHKNKAVAEFQRNAVDYNWLMAWYGYAVSLKKSPFDLNEYQNLLEKVNENVLTDFITQELDLKNINLSYIGREKISIESHPIFQ